MANDFDPKLIFHNESKGTSVEFTVREEDLLLLGDHNTISLNLNYEEVDIDKKGYIKYVTRDDIMDRVDNIDLSSKIERPNIIVPEYHGIEWRGSLEASPFKVLNGNFTHIKTTWYVSNGTITKTLEVNQGDLTKGFILPEEFGEQEVNIFVDYHVLNNDDQTESTIRSLPKYVICKASIVRVTGNFKFNLYTYNNDQYLEVHNPNVFFTNTPGDIIHKSTQFVLRKGQTVVDDTSNIYDDEDLSWTPIYKPGTVEYDTKNPAFTPRPMSKLGVTFIGNIEKDTEYYLDVIVTGEPVNTPGTEIKSNVATFSYLIDTTGTVPKLELDMTYNDVINEIDHLGDYQNFKIKLITQNNNSTKFRHLSTVCEIATDSQFQNIITTLNTIEVGINNTNDDIFVVYNNNKLVDKTLIDHPGAKLQEYVYLSDDLLDALPSTSYIRFKALYTFDSKEYDNYFKDKNINSSLRTLDISSFKNSITVKETTYSQTFTYQSVITRAPKPEITFLQNIQEVSEITSDNLVGDEMVYEFNLKLKNWENVPIGYIQQYPVDDVEAVIVFPQLTFDTSIFSKIKEIGDPNLAGLFLDQFINHTAPITVENTSDGYMAVGVKLNHKYVENRQNYEIDFDPITIKTHRLFHLCYGYVIVSTTRNGLKSFLSIKPIKLVNELAKQNTIPVLDGPMDNGKYINQFYIDNLGFETSSVGSQGQGIYAGIPDSGGVGTKVLCSSDEPITLTTWEEDKVKLTVVPGTNGTGFYIEFLEVGEGSITFHRPGYASKKFTFKIKDSLKRFAIRDVDKLYAQKTGKPVRYQFFGIDARTVEVEDRYGNLNQLQVNKTKDRIEIKSDVNGEYASYSFKAPGYQTTNEIQMNWYDTGPEQYPYRDWYEPFGPEGPLNTIVTLSRFNLLNLEFSKEIVDIEIKPWASGSGVYWEPLDGKDVHPDDVFIDYDNLVQTGRGKIMLKDSYRGNLVIHNDNHKLLKYEVRGIEPTGPGSVHVPPDPIIETNIIGYKNFYENPEFLKKFSPIVRNNLYTIPKNAGNVIVSNGEPICTNIDINHVRWRVISKNKVNQQETILTEGLGIGPFIRIFGSDYRDYIKCTDMDYYNLVNGQDISYRNLMTHFTREPVKSVTDPDRPITEDVLDTELDWLDIYKNEIQEFRKILDLEVLKDPQSTQEDKEQALKDHDKLLASFKGLKFRDYTLQKYLKQPNLYDVFIRMEILDVVKDPIFTAEIPFRPGLQSKFGKHNRVDLWANTIYKLPYITTSNTESTIDVSDIVPNGKLVYPTNPLLSIMEPVGHSKSLLKYCEKLPDNNIYQSRVLSPYVFAHKPTNEGLNHTVFDNLDHLVDMIYSLSVGVEEGHTQWKALYGDDRISLPGLVDMDGEELVDYVTYRQIAVRRNIVIHCNGAGFTHVEDNSESSLKYLHTPLDINKQPGSVTLEEKPTAYLDNSVSEQTPALDKEEIKAFLIAKNFTPEYFKANKDSCSRRIVIEVYDIAHNRYTNLLLFTEAVVVVFKEELGDRYFTGHDGYLNDYIDIAPLTKDTKSISEYPRLLNVNPKTEKPYNVLDKIDNLPDDIASYLWKIPYYDQGLVVDPSAKDFILGYNTPVPGKHKDNICVTKNSYSFMLASRIKAFKSNFDFMGMIPFRACTENSLLGFKGEFVPREEGYYIGQEVVHPITKDLYLCIKDRPGITNMDKFNMKEYDQVEHTYPVGTPTYTVLDDTDYFVKVRSHDNQSGLSEEEYRKYYRSSLPTYVSLLSYLNLLVGSHEGLICPPIHKDLVRGYTDMMTNGIKNPFSLFSYNRIYQKLNTDCIGDISGMVKKGIKQPSIDPMTVLPGDDKHHSGVLESIDVNYTNFPYHWLDAYFSETELDSNNPQWEITPKDQLTDDMEIQNSIKDALFGGWLKFRNKNYHNIIYVSSRPVLWTRDPELIAGSNILHPRQHIIRIGTKHYYVRILTDNFYPDDDCCQDEMIYNNLGTLDPDFVTFNDPNRLNFRESLISPSMMTQCELASADTPLMSRTGNLTVSQATYSYPNNNPVFTIDLSNTLIDGEAPLPNNSSLVVDKNNLTISTIGAWFRLEHTHTDMTESLKQTNLDFLNEKDYFYDKYRNDYSLYKGNLIYNADNTTNYKYNSEDIIPTGYDNLPMYKPNITYNLERQRKDLGPSFGINGSFGNNVSNVSFVFDNVNMQQGTNNKYVIDNNDALIYLSDMDSLAYITFRLETRTISGNTMYDIDDLSTTNPKSFVLKQNVKYPICNGVNILTGAISFNAVRPPEMGTYVPVHIVLEAIEEKDLPIYNIKDSLLDYLKEPGKTTFSDLVTKISDIKSPHKNTIEKIFNGDNIPQNNKATVMSYISNLKIRNGDRSFNENVTVPTFDSNTNTPHIPTIKNGGYWMDVTRDIDYVVNTNKLKDLTNYKPIISSTYDTHFNTDVSSMFGGNAFKLNKGNFNTEEMMKGHWGGYSMIESHTGNRQTPLFVYDRWNGCGYLGQFDSTTVGDYNNYLFEQLESILITRVERLNSEQDYRLEYKTLPLIHVFYFKGKIVLVPTHTPFSIYDSDYYGMDYLYMHDHLEVGRTRPINRFDAVVDRVKLGTNSFDVMLPYYSNDRSLHSNQELVRKVIPTYQYKKD